MRAAKALCFSFRLNNSSYSSTELICRGQAGGDAKHKAEFEDLLDRTENIAGIASKQTARGQGGRGEHFGKGEVGGRRLPLSAAVRAGPTAALRVPLRTLAAIRAGCGASSASTPASTTLTSAPTARAKALALARPASRVATIAIVTAEG